MTETVEDKAAQASADSALLALQARVTELEDVVHALTNNDPNHPSVFAWVEKIGARIKAAVEKVL